MAILTVHFMIWILMRYQWAECEETTNSAETKPKTFSMNFAGEIEKDKLSAFLEKIEPSVTALKDFSRFRVKAGKRLMLLARSWIMLHMKNRNSQSLYLYPRLESH